MCVYTHTARFSICLSGDGYLGCFPILAVVNNATLKMRVQLPFLFIYSFLVALGLHCCVQAFCSWQGSWDYCSLQCTGCSLQRFSCCGAQAVGTLASVVVAHGFSCSMACGIFPDKGSTCVSFIGRQIPIHCTTVFIGKFL